MPRLRLHSARPCWSRELVENGERAERTLAAQALGGPPSDVFTYAFRIIHENECFWVLNYRRRNATLTSP